MQSQNITTTFVSQKNQGCNTETTLRLRQAFFCFEVGSLGVIRGRDISRSLKLVAVSSPSESKISEAVKASLRTVEADLLTFDQYLSVCNVLGVSRSLAVHRSANETAKGGGKGGLANSSPENRQQLVFNKHAGPDGALTTKDLLEALRSMGGEVDCVQPRELDSMISAADSDGSGTFEIEEFAELFEQVRKKAFAYVFDKYGTKDESGASLASSHVPIVLTLLCGNALTLPPRDRLLEIIAEADEDGSASFDIDEFVALVDFAWKEATHSLFISVPCWSNSCASTAASVADEPPEEDVRATLEIPDYLDQDMGKATYPQSSPWWSCGASKGCMRL